MAYSISYIYQVIDKFTGPLKKITSSTDKFEKSMKKSRSAVDKLKKNFSGLGGVMTGLAASMGGKVLLDKFVGFETAMNKLESVTFATEDQMKSMRDMAKELGATTAFTAADAAEGMTYLAMAGLSTDKVLEAIPGALQLAAAGAIDLSQAADIATNVLGQMGMGVEELARVNNVLALAQSKANFNVVELFEAMRPIGTTASNLGVDLEELTAYLGAMANAGEKGSIAGTLLRNAFTELAAPSKDQIKIYKSLGLNIGEFISKSGKIKNFKYLITELRRLNKEGKLSVGALQKLYGDRGFRAMQILSGKAGENVEDLERMLNNTGDAAEKAANIQMKGLPGALKSMASAFEAVNIAIFESGLDKVIISLANGLIKVARAMSKSNPLLLRAVGIVGLLVAVLAPLLLFVTMLAPAFTLLGSIITTIFAALGISLGAITGLLAVFAAAFIGVGAAIYQIWKNWEYLTDDMERFAKWWMDTFTFDPVVEGIEKAVEKIKPMIDWFYKLDDALGFGSKKPEAPITAEEADKKWAEVVRMRREAGLWKTPEKNINQQNTPGIVAQGAAVNKNTLNGDIVVSAKEGSKVESANMKTSVPGNLGMNMAGAY